MSTILGFLAGLLVMYSSTRKKAEYSTEPIVELTTPANPVYEEVSHKEEVELNSNQAYGPLGPPKEEMELNTNQAYGPLGPPKEEMELNTNQAYGPLGPPKEEMELNTNQAYGPLGLWNFVQFIIII